MTQRIQSTLSKRMFFLFIASLSFSALSADSGLDKIVEKKTILDFEDVFKLEYAASIEFHPKQEMFVYERRSMDIMTDTTKVQLWSYDLKSKQHLPLLADGASYYSPKFSSDGSRLAYLSPQNGTPQIFVKWMNNDRSAKISDLRSSPSNLSWSPDGNFIAFTMFTRTQKQQLFKTMPKKPDGAKWAGTAKYINTTQYRSDGAGFNSPGFQQVYVISSEGGSPLQITSGDFNHGGQISWAANGKSLYFAANRDENWELLPYESDIYRIDVASGSLSNVTNEKGPESSPLISPNGEYIAYQWVNDRKLSYQVNQIMLQGTGSDKPAISLTPKLDRQIDSVHWAKDSKGLYFSYLDKGKTKLSYVSASGTIKNLPAKLGSQALGRPYTSGEFGISAKGKVVYTINDTQRPADLALMNMSKNKKPELLTSLNEDAFAHLNLAEVEDVEVKSSVDQLNIDAWIAYPPNFDPSKKYPLILEIHGGPHAAYASTFSMEVQLMAAKGYVVVWSNPRGSSSYGEDFGNLIHHNYPSQDYNDLMDVVDTTISKGFIDEKNLFITGGSGGGVLTAWSIGKTDRFAAAVVAKPVINWLSFALTADAYPFFTQYWMEDMPWNISDKLWERSPLSLVGNVSTPTMLLTGEDDYRTPMSETEQYYQALRLRQIDSAMVRIPGASHGIASRPSHLIQKVGNIIAWFEKYKTKAE
ncbi:MAG: dipeptidyl aminopeptidase/acylaminoacyl peptidase [Glaciecola sp.]|jgi:dipeptidyl aminopeptidase/acylaminoacyl peptidase